MERPWLLLPTLSWSSLKPATGETTRGGHEGGVDAPHVGTSWRISPTEVLQEGSPLLHKQVCPCNSLFQIIMNDSIELSFGLFHPCASQRRIIPSQFYRGGTRSKENIQEAQGHYQANGAAKNRFKHISVHASYKCQLILLLVLYRLNKKFNVHVTMQAKFVVSNVVMGSNYGVETCFCGNKEWKWVDFNCFPVTPLWTLWVLGIMPRTFLSPLLKFSLFSKV